jgi:hypothetical protein
VYQLLPLNGIRSFSGKWVEVCEYEDGKIVILFDDKRVSFLETQDKSSLKRMVQISYIKKRIPTRNKG